MQRERERFGRGHPTDADRDEIDENNSNNENSEYNIVLCEKKSFLISHRILKLSRDNIINFSFHIYYFFSFHNAY